MCSGTGSSERRAFNEFTWFSIGFGASLVIGWSTSSPQLNSTGYRNYNEKWRPWSSNKQLMRNIMKIALKHIEWKNYGNKEPEPGIPWIHCLLCCVMVDASKMLPLNDGCYTWWNTNKGLLLLLHHSIKSDHAQLFSCSPSLNYLYESSFHKWRNEFIKFNCPPWLAFMLRRHLQVDHCRECPLMVPGTSE